MAPPWLDVLDDTIAACTTHDRADLAETLQRKRARLLDPKVRILVLGEPRQGKSQLLNALVNAPVCAVGDDISTTVPTVIQYAESPAAALVTSVTAAHEPAALPAAEPPELAEPERVVPERIPVPIDKLAAEVGGRPGRPRRAEVVRAEVGIPRTLLATGLVLIDTPGITDPASARASRALAAVAQADAALLVSEAERELAGTELALLRQVIQACPNVMVVLTKTDTAPDWRRATDRVRSRLAAAGIPAKLVAVSAVLRMRAAQTGDHQLNDESGFPELVSHLRGGVVMQAETLSRRAVAAAAHAALDQLATQLRAELSAQAAQGPTQQVSELPELQVAQRRLNSLRRRSARWQNMLADEIADMVADIEYDLRDRTRKVLRKVDEIFDRADPEEVWDTFAEWLLENLTEAAERNFAWLIERSGWIARTVATNFPPDADGIYPDSTFEVPRELFDCVTKPDKPEFERFTPTQKVHAGLRGSYGGVLMAGLITSMAGMPIINAISLGVGTVFGGKSLYDEAEARLKRRQAAARAAAARHIDDFFLKFGKDCKDIARRVQRRLRDHFTQVTEELHESILESARDARQAVDADTVARDSRRREIARALTELAQLQARAEALATARPAAQKVSA